VFIRTLVCLFDYSVYCISMHSYICIIASHLGTLAEAREGPAVEPNPKMELVDPSRIWKDLGVYAWSGDASQDGAS
jgi:hypothetical protein